MAELTRLEEIDAQRYIENLLGLGPQLQEHQWQRDLARKAMWLGATAKATDIALDKEKLKSALEGLPYQGRYTLSDVSDIQRGLLGKYQDAPIPPLDEHGGGNAAYIAMMKYSPSTLDKGNLFSHWISSGAEDNSLVQNAIMDLDFITDIERQ